jgi:hypothetical protein
MGVFGHMVAEWVAVVLGWLLGIAGLGAVYLLGRSHGRQAQRRVNVRTVIADAIAETVPIPRPRGES